MIGVIVISAIVGTIAATVFAVIPWAQVKAAEGNLAAIRTAESVAFVHTGSYMTVAELVAAGYLEPPDGYQMAAAPSAVSTVASTGQTASVHILVGDEGRCYVAGVKAGTGAIYYGTSASPDTIRFLLGRTTTDCAPATDLLSPLGGITDGSVQVPNITSTDLANGIAGRAYAHTVDAAGATSFTLAGELPAGLTFDARTGSISGTPTTAGVATVSVTASNASGTSEARSLTLTVVDLKPAVPGGIFATTSGSTATVSWSESSTDVTSYSVGVYTSGGLEQTVIVTGNPAPQTALVPSLKVGTAYTYMVAATNEYGTSEQGSSASTTVGTILNGSFESGLDHWTSYYADRPYGYTGYAVGFFNKNNSTVYSYQKFTVPKAGTSKLSFLFQSTTDNSANVLRAGLYKNGSLVKAILSQATQQPGWYQVHTDLSGYNGQDLTIQFSLTSGYETTYRAKFDDVIINTTP
jgi:hypothetical protein